MKKCKIGISFFLLFILCLVFKQFKLLINYFFALALHELAHLLVAISRGYKLKLIQIDMFGLSIDLDAELSDKDSFAVNIAGPMCNLFLCLMCVPIYSLFPASNLVLSEFCFTNLALTLFNLLPIYPLDGGKLFRSMIKSDKTYVRLDIVVRIVFITTFLGLFIHSCFTTVNYFYLLMIIFFVTSKRKQMPTFSLFKFNNSRSFEKVCLIKVGECDNLFKMIKQIKSHKYTIFYYPTKKLYIDEDVALTLALKYPLSTEIKDISF